MSYDNAKMRIPHDPALFFTILIVATMVVASATWLYLNPRPTEQFFALGILGENMMAEHYYPGDSPNIKLGDVVKWHVTIYNHMGSVQYIAIRAKLLNQTTPPPDDLNNTASPVLFFREIRHVLVDNETWTFPFYWSAERATESNGAVQIIELKLNNMTINERLDTTAIHGHNFRIVLELWTYNDSIDGFQFGWRAGGEARTAWVQIWFNITLQQNFEGANVGDQESILSESQNLFVDGLGIQTVQASVHSSLGVKQAVRFLGTLRCPQEFLLIYRDQERFREKCSGPKSTFTEAS